MQPTEVTYYDQLASTLALAGVDVSVSDMHGIVCGTICNCARTGREPDLLALLSSGSEAAPERLDTLRTPLEKLFQAALRELRERRPEFDLLLPGEDNGLSVRGAALAEWCQGFFLGLLHEQTLAIEALPGDAAEIARDMLAISELEQVVQDTRENEWNLAQMEEYVRMGVQLIFAELEDAADDARASRAMQH
jgi:uncharacterized protein YgfB (UPF0149 family)